MGQFALLIVPVLLLAVAASCGSDTDDTQAVETEDEESSEQDREEDRSTDDRDATGGDGTSLRFGDEDDDQAGGDGSADQDSDGKQEGGDTNNDDKNNDDKNNDDKNNDDKNNDNDSSGDDNDKNNDDDSTGDNAHDDEPPVKYQKVRLTYQEFGGFDGNVANGSRKVVTTTISDPDQMRLTATSDAGSLMTVAAQGSKHEGTECSAVKSGESVTVEWDFPSLPGHTCTTTLTFAATDDYAETRVQFVIESRAMERSWGAAIVPALDPNDCFHPGDAIGKLRVTGYDDHRVDSNDNRISVRWAGKSGGTAEFDLKVEDDAAHGGSSTIEILLPLDEGIYAGSGPSPSVHICAKPVEPEPEPDDTTTTSTSSTPDPDDTTDAGGNDDTQLAGD